MGLQRYLFLGNSPNLFQLFSGNFLDCLETAQIAPDPMAGNHVDFGGFLHDGVVDRDLLAGREEAGEFGFLRRGAERRGELVHDAADLRSVGAQLGLDGVEVPDSSFSISSRASLAEDAILYLTF